MHFEDDTIAAISTPIGQGGIGIVRVSGSGAIELVSRIFRPRNNISLSEARPFSIVYGHMAEPISGAIVDEVLVSVMRSPHSYTREDVVEINSHGGMVSVKKVLELVLAQGARLADPGEFTKRAFLNGRINLTQAEAVADLISARTEEGLRLAMQQLRGELSLRLQGIRQSLIEIAAHAEAYLDFPEDEIEPGECRQLQEDIEKIRKDIEHLSATFQEARFFREGLSVAIVGRPNVGKSSLLNALLKKDRAIVTDIPGTTRDLIEEGLNLEGLPVRIIDTAGIRLSDEAVEREGIKRSLGAMEDADFIIALLDGSEDIKDEDILLLDRIKNRNALIAINKADLPCKISLDNIASYGKQYLYMSAATGEGLAELIKAVVASNLKNWKEEREGVVVTNLRHKIALDLAGAALKRAAGILGSNQPLEIFSLEMRDALDSIGEITGVVTTDDILNKIFSDFCIGK
ncbi:MAG: tRNA uridine-5-carboxymethylaminomethyl(34) synthesis GTPase MnmE [Nitrospirae bacterium]|nr:tRNA uridine-5-carboxymethylaminomethyl(34) synthesis GTPase MnmE [Nitrospirota bacterium]